MERQTRTPLGVFLAFCIGFYATGLAHVWHARGSAAEALTAALLALAAALVMLRAAERPA